MYDNVADVLDGMRAAPEVFAALLAGVTHEQAAAALGGDEGWSVVEVLCHLRDAEEIAMQRNLKMRDEDNPPIAGYDQERLAVERDYASENLESALRAFLDFRARHLAVLEALTPEQWRRRGQHSDMGEITVFDHTVHMGFHDSVHAAQIARQLGKA